MSSAALAWTARICLSRARPVNARTTIFRFAVCSAPVIWARTGPRITGSARTCNISVLKASWSVSTRFTSSWRERK